MEGNSSNNKTIAKNTVVLYLRMILTTLVSLYTSRVVLQTLGVEDFGIYGVVGGVVTMFAFLKSTMSGATSRFITFALGKGDQRDLDDTFATVMWIHIFIAIAIFILAESVGLWFLEKKLVIPDGRMNAARIVYQFSILSMMITVTQVPYNASIISHEKMNVYAYVEILNAILKLLIVFLLAILPFDRLIVYSILVFIVYLVIAMIYRIYCSRKFGECHIRRVWRKDLFQPMLTFSGWDLYGNMCYTVKNQGVNMLINMFFGVVYNAASSVSHSILGVVSNFSTTVIQAFRPQIVKSFANSDIRRMEALISNATKYSLLLFSLCTVPIILEADTILQLWLGEVPDSAPIFCRLMLITCTFELINRIVGIGIHATGEMKRISLITGTVHILCLPCIYVKFKLFDVTPAFAYIWLLITMVMVGISNILILRKQIPDVDTSCLFTAILKAGVIIILSTIPTVCVYFLLHSGVIRLMSVCLTYTLVAFTITYCFGIDKSQRQSLNLYIRKKIHFQ